MKIPEATEIVAGFMEPKPDKWAISNFSPLFWWRWKWHGYKEQFMPNEKQVHSLDSLREVEARLTEEQRERYAEALRWDDTNPMGHRFYRNTFYLIHASAEQKLLALSEVLASATEQQEG